MITRWSSAHERLQQQLEVRTHRRKEREAPKSFGRSPIPEEHKDVRSLKIGRREFKSINAARKALRTSPRRIYQLIEAGEASFL